MLHGVLNRFPWVECPKPMGGTFILVDITKLGISDVELAKFLVERGIMTDYGSAWGPTGTNHLRLTIANPTEYLKKGVEQLVEALTEYSIIHKDRLLT